MRTLERRRGRGEAPQATLNIVETFSVTFGKIFFDDFSTLKISFSVFYDGQSKDLDFGQRWHKYRTQLFFSDLCTKIKIARTVELRS